MESAIWSALSEVVRAEVDALVRQDRRMWAVKVMRESCPEPKPGLYACVDVVVERYRVLGQGFERAPTPPLDLDVLTAAVGALPGRPVAIEALWDGDTEGWFVVLLALTDDPQSEHQLALVRHGGDIRLFNGTVPPWPEAREAEQVGRALADHLGVPFHFPSPDRPDDEAPRWRTTGERAPDPRAVGRPRAGEGPGSLTM
ncbi:hypothetical protein [Kitasatospora mediocidica]|uniref:hypothetical protein n=1 Tax=Kitasatospora mediocidica TaxID=58352 RepID=UPI0007C7E6CE|nr:hypothetical protein [Kitasatospora mediocidica]